MAQPTRRENNDAMVRSSHHPRGIPPYEKGFFFCYYSRTTSLHSTSLTMQQHSRDRPHRAASTQVRLFARSIPILKTPLFLQNPISSSPTPQLSSLIHWPPPPAQPSLHKTSTFFFLKLIPLLPTPKPPFCIPSPPVFNHIISAPSSPSAPSQSFQSYHHLRISPHPRTSPPPLPSPPLPSPLLSPFPSVNF